MVFTAVLFVAGFCYAQGDAQKDQQALQGTWKVTKVVSAGKAQPEDLVKQITVLFEGDKVTVKLAADVLSESSFKLDAAKNPKQIDATSLTGPDKAQKKMSIYELNGDELKLCHFIGDEGLKKRPASFDDDKTEPTSTMYLQRQKK